jgi:hypothetical protein
MNRHGKRQAVKVIGKVVHTGSIWISAEEAKAFVPGASYTFEVTDKGWTYTHCGCVPEMQEDGRARIRFTRDTMAGRRPAGTPQIEGLRNRLARRSNGAPA